MKKFYLRFLLVVLAALICGATAQAQTLYELNGINYAVLNDTQAYVYEAVSKTSVSGDVVIPQTVTLDGKAYTVTCIDGTAFKDCAGITSMTLPTTIDSIGGQAFNGCSAMKSINLGDTQLRYLSTSTFLYCRSLETITLPATVTQVGINPFMETLALKEIKVAAGNKALTSIDGVLFTADKKTLIAFPAGHSKSYVVPDGTETIANSAFCMARNLCNVTFPASLKTIENSGFLRVDSLRLIELPAGIEKLGSSAFAECKVATGEIILPSTLKSLGAKAFYYTSISKLEIPGSIASIPTDLARYCVKLRSIKLNEGTTMIYGYAFNTTAISEIVIPNSVTRIRECVFTGCTLLKNVTLGSGLKTIDTQVFYNLTGLQKIECLSQTPPSIADYANYPAFTQQVYNNCRLDVPEGCLYAYKAAETWKNFESIKSEGIGSSPSTEIKVVKSGNGIEISGAGSVAVQVYNLTGQLVYYGADGYIPLTGGHVYIVRIAERIFKIAV